MPEPRNLRKQSLKDIEKRSKAVAFMELMKMGAHRQGVQVSRIKPRTDHYKAREN